METLKWFLGQVDVEAMPDDESNPYGNGFVVKETNLEREIAAQRVAAPEKGRVWKIKNPASTHPYTGGSLSSL